jgi:hypothetical protein
MQEQSYINMYFKIPYTTQTMNYLVNPNWSLTQFIENIKIVSKNYFNIQNDNNEFIIIPTGQYNLSGKAAEEGYPLEMNDTITLNEKFRDKIKTTSFYIKFNRTIIPEDILYNFISKPNYILLIKRYFNPVLCFICFNDKYEYFIINGCIHEVCVECYIRCRNVNLLRCPLCREGHISNCFREPRNN